MPSALANLRSIEIKRLAAEGFEFQFPHLGDALADILSSLAAPLPCPSESDRPKSKSAPAIRGG
jgi:hypothetical protein